jgi:hypothetical protein
MVRRYKALLRIVLPLTAALAVIRLEPYLTELVRNRPGVLPVAMFGLIGCLLIPRIRQMMIVTLCFGIMLLAMHDAFGNPRLPAAIDYLILERLYPLAWGALALLAFASGLAEALRPGEVWARRCYFGAAAVYLCGHGLLAFLRYPSVQSAILFATGLFALAGVFMAARIVSRENEEEIEEDLRMLAVNMENRSRVMAAREWKEARD